MNNSYKPTTNTEEVNLAHSFNTAMADTVGCPDITALVFQLLTQCQNVLECRSAAAWQLCHHQCVNVCARSDERGCKVLCTVLRFLG